MRFELITKKARQFEVTKKAMDSPLPPLAQPVELYPCCGKPKKVKKCQH